MIQYPHYDSCVCIAFISVLSFQRNSPSFVATPVGVFRVQRSVLKSITVVSYC